MKRIITIFLFTAITLGGMAQDPGQIGKIHEKLGQYFQYNPVESIFLITDKEVYKPGETLWFNGFAGQLDKQGLAQSGQDINVALYDTSGKPVVSDVYRISNGLASGDIILPITLVPGKYALAAHTPTMQHGGEAFIKLIFIDPMDKNEVIARVESAPDLLVPGANNLVELSLAELSGDDFSSNRIKYELLEQDQVLLKGKLKTGPGGKLRINLEIPEKEYSQPVVLHVTDKNLNFSRTFPVNTEKLNVQFYAEGGNFVAGTPLKVGYQVTNAWGQPVDITAEILSEDAGTVMQTKTLVPGFGVFSLQAQAGVRYKLHVTSDRGSGQAFELPAFQPDGFVCSIPKTDDEFIYANLVFTDGQSHTVNLLATRGNQLFWASGMKVDGAVRAKIPKENFPQGLCLLAAFDEAGKPIGERMLYIEKGQSLNMELETNTHSVTTGKPFTLTIKTTPRSGNPAPGTASVSVSAAMNNLDQTAPFSPCFEVNNYLENKIPGLEQLADRGLLPEHSVNYLLTCNRFRNFSWPAVLAFDPENLSANPTGNWLSGIVFDRNNHPVSKAKVSLVNTGNAQIITVTTDENGHFIFQGIASDEHANYVVKAIDAAGNDQLTISYERGFGNKLQRQIQQFIAQQSSTERPLPVARFFADNAGLFSEIRKKSSPEPKKNESYKQMLNSGSSIMDAIKTIKPYTLDGEKIIFPGGQNSLLAQDGALIVIDGQKMGTSSSVLNGMSPNDVESINVSTSPMDILRYTGLNSVGLIEINTKRGEIVPGPVAPTENLYRDAYRISRDFAQTMLVPGNKDQTTLYWNAAITFDETGTATVQIPTNNVTGSFQIEVIGIDEQGRIGKALQNIQIEK